MKPLARKNSLLAQELGDELVLYDKLHNSIHLLNRTAALIWDFCDGRTSVSQIAARLQRELEAPVDEQVVRHSLNRFGRARLLVGPSIPTVSTTGIQRREMLRRLARFTSQVAGLSVLYPVIKSISAPEPAAAQDDLCVLRVDPRTGRTVCQDNGCRRKARGRCNKVTCNCEANV